MTKAELQALLDAAVNSAVEAKLAPAIAAHTKETNEKFASMFGVLQKSGPAKPAEGEQRGLKLAAFMMAVAGSALSVKAGQPVTPAGWAEKRWGKDSDVAKALSVTTSTEGGFLFGEEVSSDFIELLRPASVVRQMNPVVVPMVDGKLLLSGLSGGATFSYIGENKKAPASQPAFRQVRGTSKKGAVFVPISNDLLRKPSANGLAHVRDDMIGAAGAGEDAAFIRSQGTQYSPKGLRYQAAAANIIPANATVNLANVTVDLGKIFLALANANVRFLRPGFLMAPRTAVYLMSVRDGNGNYAFRDEMLAGKLQGFPWKWTTQIPINLGGGSDESELYLADFADVVIGEQESVIIEVSGDAAYDDGTGTMVSAFQQDQTVVRLITEHDLVVRHAESVAVLTALKWL